MQVQLNSLLRRIIHALRQIIFYNAIDHHRAFVGKIIIAAIALNHHTVAVLQALYHILHGGALLLGNGRLLLLRVFGRFGAIAQEHFAFHGTGIIGYIEGNQQHFALADFLFLVVQALAGNDHLARVVVQLPYRNRLFQNRPAANQAALFLLCRFPALFQLLLMLARQFAPLLQQRLLGTPLALQAGVCFLAHTRHPANHLRAHAEDVIDCRIDLFQQAAFLQIPHGKIIRKLQNNLAVLRRISHILFPCGNCRMLAQ